MTDAPAIITQIVCDNCTDFAKAILEGRHLCAGCLLRELMSAKDSSLFEQLLPLSSKETAVARWA